MQDAASSHNWPEMKLNRQVRAKQTEQRNPPSIANEWTLVPQTDPQIGTSRRNAYSPYIEIQSPSNGRYRPRRYKLLHAHWESMKHWSISTSVSLETNPNLIRPRRSASPRLLFAHHWSWTQLELVNNCSKTSLESLCYDQLTPYRQVSPAPDLHILHAHDRWPYQQLIIIGDANCGLSFVVFGGRHVLRRKSVDGRWRWGKLQWCVGGVFQRHKYVKREWATRL
jgi:hypothetical protein